MYYDVAAYFYLFILIMVECGQETLLVTRRWDIGMWNLAYTADNADLNVCTGSNVFWTGSAKSSWMDDVPPLSLFIPLPLW